MEELNLTALENALKQLQEGLDRAKSDPNDELWRDGVIQRFEYSMDLCWKLIQRYLTVIAQVSDSSIRTKKDLFREAAKRDLISNIEAWFKHYEARNETSHTYDKEIAKKVFNRAAVFLPDAKILLESLRDAT